METRRVAYLVLRYNIVINSMNSNPSKVKVLEYKDFSEFIDGVFRYFEYLIIVGGTFGIMFYTHKNIFTACLYFGFLGILGLTSRTLVEKHITSKYWVHIFGLSLVYFNAIFTSTLVEVILFLSK